MVITKTDLKVENARLQSMLQEAEDTLEGIRTGQIDAIVVRMGKGPQVFTLKSSNQTYRVFIEKMQEGALTLNKDGTILYCNARFADMVNAPREKLLGLNFCSLLPEKNLENFWQLFKNAFHADIRGEITILNMQLQQVPLMISLTPIDIEGMLTVSIILSDVTQLKETENELKIKNRVLEEAERQAGIGSWQWDLRSGKISRSKELHSIFEYDPHFEKPELNETDYMPPEHRTIYSKTIAAAIEDLNPFEVYVEIKTKKETVKILHVRGNVIAENGKAVKIFGSSQDVTTLKKFESQLKERNEQLLHAQRITTMLNAELESTVQERTKELLLSKENFRFLADNIPQVVWQANHTGNMVFYNRRWIEFTGQTFESSKGWGWLNVVHPEDLESSLEAWKYSIATGKLFLHEHRFKGKNNEYRWHLGRAQPIYSETGEIEMWIGTNADIHDQKITSEKKDEFISMASHELKTPLTSARAYLQLLERNVENPVHRTYVEKANRNVEKLHFLVASLLDVSKIEAGKLELLKTEFEISESVKDWVEGFQYTITNHTIECVKSAYCKVTADKDRIEQVLINFLSNAAKYSPKSEKILVNVYLSDGFVNVGVTDFGLGIPKDKLKHLFEKFYRVEGVSKNFEGLGIGLYISSQIIERHQGKITVESSAGNGSTFTFSLPLG
jgi:two-component system phosphate regulon sensor histidine kinase PhoR